MYRHLFQKMDPRGKNISPFKDFKERIICTNRMDTKITPRLMLNKIMFPKIVQKFEEKGKYVSVCKRPGRL